LNKKSARISTRSLSKAIFIRFFGSLSIFTVALMFFFFAGRYICSKLTWYGTEIIYPILNLIDDYPLFSLAFFWFVGFFLLYLIFWKKVFGYMDTIVEASNTLVANNDELVRLPAELKEVEDRMNQMKRAATRNARLLKQEEQRKNDLIVYLAHDLKTPLTSVIGYLSLLRDEPHISDELRTKYLSISLEKAERLEELINEFFEITRFNLSEQTLEISQLNLTRMLEQIIFEFQPMFSEKNLQCTLHAAPDIKIKCDANKMERVFDNLIRNAINYSFENSTIEIHVNTERTGVSILFRNHGNTIPEEKLERIFEQFYRLDASRTTRTGGAGLGLAIAKEIVELHQGTIKAASENEAIEFTVYLPMLP
jgi:two-component system sensor histidine kinase VanS